MKSPPSPWPLQPPGQAKGFILRYIAFKEHVISILSRASLCEASVAKCDLRRFVGVSDVFPLSTVYI